MSAIVRPLGPHTPILAESAFVADTAAVLGEVELGEDSSVWYGCVLRGDVGLLKVGRRTNIQDLTVCHATTDHSSMVLGDEVTVGHRVILHGCTVHDRVLVGMGSIVLDLAVLESDVVLGAGSLVPPKARLESGWLYLGNPARKVRRLTDTDRAMIETGWRSYVELARRHRGA
ncbi:MAG: gamma carbonic anhydrase family protein [Deltaproteobacteria bacterium]|nr:gamma carbonic anhydrase family protein [Deltaproteobacteria bacterium]